MAPPRNYVHPAYREGQLAAEEGNKMRRALKQSSLKFVSKDEARIARIWMAGFDSVLKNSVAAKSAGYPK
jgi:hypothetical protein